MAILAFEQFSTIQLFHEVAYETVGYLLERCPERTLEVGDVLLTPGAENDDLYLVLSGPPSVHITISLGVAGVGGGHSTTEEQLLAAADDALYRAKRGGRNRTSR